MRALRAFIAFALLLAAPASPAPTHALLPLRSLRLDETGVGYFERSGTLEAQVATSLPVSAGHLDDALASLVVLNAGAGDRHDAVREALLPEE
jgi:hypothetical protein